MIKIYSVMSLNLYNAEEEAVRAEISSLNRDKRRFIMTEAVTYVEDNESKFNKVFDKLSNIESLEGKIDFITTKSNKLFTNLDWKDIYESAKGKEGYIKILDGIKTKNSELRVLIGKNDEVRTLNFEPNTKNEISIFESTLTRTLGLKDGVNTEILQIQLGANINLPILKSICINGFMWNNVKYVYLFSSAGNARVKKSLWIREDLISDDKIYGKLFAELTLGHINARGGVNASKYNAYFALSASSSKIWENFDIDKCIVVPDVMVDVVDSVDIVKVNDTVKYEVCSKREFRDYVLNLIENSTEHKSYDIKLFSNLKFTEKCKVLTTKDGRIKNMYISYFSISMKQFDKHSRYILTTTNMKIKSVKSIRNAQMVNKFKNSKAVKLIKWNDEIVRDDEYVDNMDLNDGAGLILSNSKMCVADAFQIRLPFFKGLMVKAPWKRFIKDHCKDKVVVTDVWGKEWELGSKGRDKDIEVIFTESQFKMAGYYDSWEEYKKAFKTYQCEACITSESEDELDDDMMNKSYAYQHLQTLDISDEKLEELVKNDLDLVTKAHTDYEVAFSLYGLDRSVLSAQQECLKLYPELRGDKYFSQDIKNSVNSYRDRLRAGKIHLGTTYLFCIPDVVLWMKKLFNCNSDKVFELEKGECYISSDKIEYGKVLINRNPGLFREHGIQKNVDINAKNEYKYYNAKNVIYCNGKDLLYKLLALDYDGDHLMVTTNKLLIDIAEKNMENIRPVISDMVKGGKQIIDGNSIYLNLKATYSGSNIGSFSNKITKLVKKGSMNEEDLKLCKILGVINNWCIDFAKTNVMVELDDEIKSRLDEIGNVMPYFFRYAKTDTELQNYKVEECYTNHVVDRICKIVDDNTCKNGKGIRYTWGSKITINPCVLSNSKNRKGEDSKDMGLSLMDKNVDIIKKFVELKIEKFDTSEVQADNYFEKWCIVYENKRNEFSKFVGNGNYKKSVNIIIKVLYSNNANIDDKFKAMFGVSRDSMKNTLWKLFARDILNNIKDYLGE